MTLVACVVFSSSVVGTLATLYVLFLGRVPFHIVDEDVRASRRSAIRWSLSGCCVLGLIIAGQTLMLPPVLVGSESHKCSDNLRKIEFAKTEWARVNGAVPCSIVATNEIDILLRTYRDLAKVRIPLECPAGGHYEYGRVGEPPTCSLQRMGVATSIKIRRNLASYRNEVHPSRPVSVASPRKSQ